MTTRDWSGLEAVGLLFLQLALVLTVVWATALAFGLLRNRVWAWWAAVNTLVMVAGCSAIATWDTARRVLDDPSAPARHLAFPTALAVLSTAALILLVTPRARSEFLNARRHPRAGI
ncbi:MAG TPA: hypothetical protein VK988_10240 [Acidimicrobiales bacterium]|nr:hypothetical protein [Acidimicrobiales bacterium]